MLGRYNRKKNFLAILRHPLRSAIQYLNFLGKISAFKFVTALYGLLYSKLHGRTTFLYVSISIQSRKNV